MFNTVGIPKILTVATSICVMIRKIIGRIWRKTPRLLRLRLIRTSQNKFTASAGAIVVNDKKEVLLLDHLLRTSSNWGLPGGFINDGEQPKAAIRREVFEETGLDLSEVNLFLVRTLDRHIEVLFTAKPIGEARVRSREINDLGWFGIDELPRGLSETLKQMVKDAVGRSS